MLANTLTTSYRHDFNWWEQTFAYFTFDKLSSDRFNHFVVYWDQSTGYTRDEWDVYYKTNYSFDYVSDYAKSPSRSLEGLKDYFYYSKDNTEDYINKLWPREMVYVYAVNRGDTP